MARALLEYETIDAPQIDAIMEGRDVPPPMGWNKNGSGKAGSDAAPPAAPIGGPATQT
jgi:cell division protease FtsH